MAVITVSRQYGSGGDEIAARVCETLGYRLFDKRLMAQVAAELGMSQSRIVDFSEADYRVPGLLERLFVPSDPRLMIPLSPWMYDTGITSVELEWLDDDWCARMAEKTILAACEQGNVVLVGRGGQAILRDEPGALHVRVEAPLSERVDRVRDQQHISLKEARKRVTERDRAAAAYLKRFCHIDWADPRHYHLAINSGRWGIEAAAQLIVHAVSCLQPAEASAEPAA